MSRAPQNAVLIAIALVLTAILAVLVTVAIRGIRFEHSGTVAFGVDGGAITLTMAEPVRLEMPTPATLVATGPDGESIAMSLSLVECPECDTAMVPTRWNLLSGEIEWTCPACGEETTAPAE